MSAIGLIAIFAFALIAIGNASPFQTRAGCSFDVEKSLSAIPPMFLQTGTTSFVRAANSQGNIKLNAGQSMTIACPGSGNYLTVRGTSVQETTATCGDGTAFTVDGTKYDISELKCNKFPSHVTRTSGSCGSGKSAIQIGFEVAAGFVQVIYVCHDTALSHTVFTKFQLTKDANGFQHGVDRPDWIAGDFFQGLQPTELYKRVNQRAAIAQILNSNELADKYIHPTNDYFLSKGHLVAKADFLYAVQQMATFWYLNAAPQWQTFNGNNWNALENDLRSFAARIQKDLDVYTGTWGLATLPDINNNNVDLHLSPGTNPRRMPVPRMFWKVAYDPNTQAGIAFIGLNNPYQMPDSISADIRCNDICSQISWLTWTQKDIVKGYSYCCEVNDFRKSFPDLPAFTVTSVLK